MPAGHTCIHVDVFSPRPYSGNRLAVLLDTAGLDGKQMAAITKERRHFESIFLASSTEDTPTHLARMFDLNEELDFASHPLIAIPELERKLAGSGAQFAYLLNAKQLDTLHRNNDAMEDVATCSGTGCAAAYLRSHDRIGDGESLTLKQGRFTGRPSEITTRAHSDRRSVQIGGEGSIVGEGRLRKLPGGRS